MKSRSEIAEQISKKLGLRMYTLNYLESGAGEVPKLIWDALISASVELEELRARQNGWIAVEELLPEYDTDVLLWGAGWGAVYLGYWRHSEEWIGRHRAESDAAELPKTNPTHWQPLPAAPGAAAEERHRLRDALEELHDAIEANAGSGKRRALTVSPRMEEALVKAQSVLGASPELS